MRRNTLVALIASSAVHAGALTLLPEPVRSARPNHEASVVDFEVHAASPVEEPEPPPSMEEAPHDPVVAPTRTEKASKPRSEPSEPTTAGSPSPVDLTGVTLTNQSGGAWASAVGNGRTLTTGVGVGRTAPAVESKAPPRATPRENFVPIGDLSERPVPPNLNAALKRNYPPAAHRQGLSGRAAVRARISKTGRPGAIRILSESAPGFGRACKHTLSESVWSPPRAHSGERVATEVRYTCLFTIED